MIAATAVLAGAQAYASGFDRDDYRYFVDKLARADVVVEGELVSVDFLKRLADVPGHLIVPVGDALVRLRVERLHKGWVPADTVPVLVRDTAFPSWADTLDLQRDIVGPRRLEEGRRYVIPCWSQDNGLLRTANQYVYCVENDAVTLCGTSFSSIDARATMTAFLDSLDLDNQFRDAEAVVLADLDPGPEGEDRDVRQPWLVRARFAYKGDVAPAMLYVHARGPGDRRDYFVPAAKGGRVLHLLYLVREGDEYVLLHGANSIFSISAGSVISNSGRETGWRVPFDDGIRDGCYVDEPPPPWPDDPDGIRALRPYRARKN
jgi:hypothetical protein